MNQPIGRRDAMIISAGGLLLLAGAAGDLTRWFRSEGGTKGLVAASQRLSEVPLVFGEWEGTDTELSPREIEAAGIHSWLRRTYRNTQSGYVVHLTILCGRSGPMVVHPPTACFEGIGYEQTSAAVPYSVSVNRGSGQGTEAEQHPNSGFMLRRAGFRPAGDGGAKEVRVFWAWGDHSGWVAPESPRMHFRGRSWLYKLYVTDSRTGGEASGRVPQAERFLEEFAPVLRQLTAAPSRDSGSSATSSLRSAP